MKDDKKLTMSLDKQRWWWMTGNERVFYGSLLCGLKDKVDPSQATACTDGISIHWNPDYVEALVEGKLAAPGDSGIENLRYIMGEETIHCAHGHMWRLGNRDKEVANVAMDYEAFAILQKIPGLKPPNDGGVRDLPKEFENKSWEEIYEILIKRKGKGPGKGPKPRNPFGDPPPGEGKGEKEKEPGKKPGKPGDGKPHPPDPEKLKEEWERRVIQAAQIAKAQGRGDFPASLQGMLEKIMHQPIDWRREMADFVKNMVSTKPDWTRSAKRHAWQPVVYPRRKADELGLCIFARDFSGSVGDRPGGQFTSMVEESLAETGCRGLVIDWDTNIHKEQWIAPGERVSYERPCGGGTSFVCVSERIKKLIDQGEQIAGVVILTDGDVHWGEPLDIPTLTVCSTRNVTPWGRTIKIEDAA